jgi:flagellar biosynthesis regulator FlbT
MLFAIIGNFETSTTTLIVTSDDYDIAYKAACKMLLDHSELMNCFPTDQETIQEVEEIRSLVKNKEYKEALIAWTESVQNSDSDESITVDDTAEIFNDLGNLDVS